MATQEEAKKLAIASAVVCGTLSLFVIPFILLLAVRIMARRGVTGEGIDVPVGPIVFVGAGVVAVIAYFVSLKKFSADTFDEESSS